MQTNAYSGGAKIPNAGTPWRINF